MYKLRRVYICDKCGKMAKPIIMYHGLDTYRSRPLGWEEIGNKMHLCPECHEAFMAIGKTAAKVLYPMGDITFAIACAVCKNRESDACMECKMEAKSGFEIDPNIRIVHEPTETKVGAENETAKSEN